MSYFTFYTLYTCTYKFKQKIRIFCLLKNYINLFLLFFNEENKEDIGKRKYTTILEIIFQVPLI